MSGTRKVIAETLGTFWLVLGGCGSAVIAATVADTGIGMLGVSLAFGLSVLTMAFAIGHISGCHLNPAVTVGLWTAGRFPGRDIFPYICGQVAGATAAAMVLLFIASGSPDYNLGALNLAQNGYGQLSPGGYSLASGFAAETILTFGFLLIIIGATDRRAPAGFAPIAIGLALTLIHLVSIPITNTSVNPARSTGPALLVGGEAAQQLWMFWVAPMLGAVVGGIVYRLFFSEVAEESASEKLSGSRRDPAPEPKFG